MSEPIWNVESLKEQVDQRFTDNDKAIQAALVAQEKATAAALAATKEAINKAEAAAEKRFESVNGFRQQLNDQASTLMPRQEYTVQHKALEDKITDLTDRMNTTLGKEQGSSVTKTNLLAYIGAAVGILGAIILLANNVFK